MLTCDCDIFKLQLCFVLKTSPRRWPDYWPKHVGEDIINKNTS